ncbi:MAG TPA: STAS domain-containing protein [Actinotalea sp.]
MRDGNSRTPDGPVEPTGDADTGGVLDTGETPVIANGADGRGEPASVHVIVKTDRCRIVLSGEVDADLAADLREATADAESTGLPIEVDAQHVTFMDSSGIAFLARIATRSAERVTVIRAPETVRFLLEVTRIGELLDVLDEPAPEVAPHVPTIGPGGRTRTPAAQTPDGIA